MKYILLLPLFLSLSGCDFFSNPPGKGKKAQIGYSKSIPVIEALSKFKSTTGNYPDELHKLIPKYISKIPPEINGSPSIYKKTPSGFSLGFHYTEFFEGYTGCLYTPQSQWKCWGHY